MTGYCADAKSSALRGKLRVLRVSLPQLELVQIDDHDCVHDDDGECGDDFHGYQEEEGVGYPVLVGFRDVHIGEGVAPPVVTGGEGVAQHGPVLILEQRGKVAHQADHVGGSNSS